MQKADFSVLIVEDHPVHIAQLVKLLDEYTNDVLVSTSAGRGLLAFEGSLLVEKDHYDMILVDMNLPGMNGKEFIARVRILEKNHPGVRVRVVAMSADPPKMHVMEACRLGAGCYLEKPVTKEKIDKVLKDAGFLDLQPESAAQDVISEQKNNQPLEKEVVKVLFSTSAMFDKIAAVKTRQGTEFFDAFKGEIEDILERAEESLLQLEIDPHNKDLIDAIFRDFHTVKGNFGMMSLEGLNIFTHHLEDIFSKIRSGQIEATGQVIDAALKGRDFLSKMMDPDQGENLDPLQIKVLSAIQNI